MLWRGCLPTRALGIWPRPKGARIQTSRSSSVLGMTGIAFGWIGSMTVFGDGVENRRPRGAGDRFRLRAAVALEFGPDVGEREQRPVFVQGEPDHVL